MRTRSRGSDFQCECEGGGGNKKLINANHIEPKVDTGRKIAKKKPMNVKVRKIPGDFFVQTLEGKMFGRAGDYLAIGTHGERYIIRKEIFEDTYDIIRDINAKD